MIKLEKLPEPEILRRSKAEWTEEYKAAKATKAKNLDAIRTRYRHTEIKEQIVRETHGKCAYCESKIRHVYPGDIEHIIPKSLSDDDIFEWENLTLACGECNRRKLDNFDDEIGILNPYKVDPEEHLMAVGPLIFPKLNDQVGKLAYELFELDRFDLVERRTDHLKKLRVELDNYSAETNELLKKFYKRKIEQLKDASNEYAMITRAFVKATSKPVRRRAK